MYVCVRLHATGKIDLRLRNFLCIASLLTYGRSDRFRLNKYGSFNYNNNKFVESFMGIIDIY